MRNLNRAIAACSHKVWKSMKAQFICNYIARLLQNFGDVSPTTLSPEVSPSNSCDEGEGARYVSFTQSFTFRDMGWSRRGQGSDPPPPEKSQNIGFHSCTGPDPLKNLKATKPAFNVGPSSARQRNAIQWRFAGEPMIVRFFVVFGSSLPS